MPEITALELIGDVFTDGRKFDDAEISQSDVMVEIWKLNPGKQPPNHRQLLDTLDPLVSHDLMANMFGPGRFLVIAKRKDKKTILTQTTVDVANTGAFPQEEEEPEYREAPVSKAEIEQTMLEVLERVGLLGDQPTARRPQAPPAADDRYLTLLEKLLLEKDKSNPMANPAVMTTMMTNLMNVQAEAMKGTMARDDKRENFKLETEQRRQEREWKMEDRRIEMQQEMALARLEAEIDKSDDPQLDYNQGSGAEALLKVISETFGVGKASILGIDLEKVLGPLSNELSQAAASKGVYILTKGQLVGMLNTARDQGTAIGQQQALNAIKKPTTPPQPPPRPAPTRVLRPVPKPQPKPQPQTETEHGQDDRQPAVGEELAGRNDLSGGQAGGGGEPEAGGAYPGGADNTGSELTGQDGE